MPLFEWKPMYSVGVATVDSQHQKLIGYMNTFHDAHQGGKVKEARGALMALLRYTKIHFTDEESMMEKSRYPEFRKHQAAHMHMLGVLGKLATAYDGDPTDKNADNMGRYLKNWLADHILVVDKLYVPYLNRQGKA